MELLMLSHIFFSKRPSFLRASLHQVFVYKTYVLCPLLQFWRCAPEEDVQAQDQGDNAWWAGTMLRMLCITKACPTFLKSSKVSWLATLASRSHQRLVTRKNNRLTVATEPSIDLDRYRYQLMHPSFPTRSTGTQSWPPSFGPPGTTFKLDCSYHLCVFYENI